MRRDSATVSVLLAEIIGINSEFPAGREKMVMSLV